MVYLISFFLTSLILRKNINLFIFGWMLGFLYLLMSLFRLFLRIPYLFLNFWTLTADNWFWCFESWTRRVLWYFINNICIFWWLAFALWLLRLLIAYSWPTHVLKPLFLTSRKVSFWILIASNGCIFLSINFINVHNFSDWSSKPLVYRAVIFYWLTYSNFQTIQCKEF